MSQSTPPVGRAVTALALALVLGILTPSAPVAAEDTTEPPALSQVYEFKPEDQACTDLGSEIVERSPWTESFLGLPSVHRLSTGEGTHVAVLATELDAQGPALEGAVEGGGTGDCLGHGTLLASLVGARPVRGSGTVGVAPGASLSFVPTGDPDTGLTSAGQIADGITTAVGSGADIVLVGTATWQDSPELEEAVERADDAGTLIVAPATVNTVRGPLPGHPAQYRSVLSVGAHDPEGLPLVPSALVRPDGDLARIDLLAPGDRVVGSGPGGAHVAGAGAGVAAAFAAGAAALLISREPGITPDQIRERLVSTAYSSPWGSQDPVSGGGRIDPLGSLVSAPTSGGAPVTGDEFVPDPSPRGSLDSVPTAAVVGSFCLMLVMSVLAFAVVRNGRARDWRPASPEEAVPIGPASKR